MRADRTGGTFTTKEAAILATAGLRALTQDRQPLETLHEVVLQAEGIEISEGTIKKAVEDKVVPVRHGRRKGSGRARLISGVGVAYLAVQGAIDLPLPREEKRRLQKWIGDCMASRSGSCGPLRFGKALSLDASVPDFLASFGQAIALYCHARDRYIERNPRVLGGTPVIKGTRISVYAIAGRLDDGDTMESVIADYSHVTAEALEAAIAYARTNPRVGRPKRFR